MAPSCTLLPYLHPGAKTGGTWPQCLSARPRPRGPEEPGETTRPALPRGLGLGRGRGRRHPAVSPSPRGGGASAFPACELPAQLLFPLQPLRHFCYSRPIWPPKGSCRPGLRRADPQAECGRPRGRGGCCSGCRPWPPGPRARGAGRRRPRCQVTGAPAARARAPSSPAPRRREDAPRPRAAEAGTAGGFFPASREAPPAGAACAGGRPNLASRSLGLLWSLLALGLFMIL